MNDIVETSIDIVKRDTTNIWIPVDVVERMRSLKVIPQEPWYSVVERALDALEAMPKKKR